MAEATSRRFLIDLTDDRFKTDENRDVIDFIRRKNPFAHSDVGDYLIRLAKAVPGIEWYCPSYGAYAYVVIHTPRSRIFGIAYGMTGLALRLARSSIADALGERAAAATEIGDDWVTFEPWPVDEPSAVSRERVRRWCERAFREAEAATP